MVDVKPSSSQSEKSRRTVISRTITHDNPNLEALERQEGHLHRDNEAPEFHVVGSVEVLKYPSGNKLTVDDLERFGFRWASVKKVLK